MHSGQSPRRVLPPLSTSTERADHPPQFLWHIPVYGPCSRVLLIASHCTLRRDPVWTLGYNRVILPSLAAGHMLSLFIRSTEQALGQLNLCLAQKMFPVFPQPLLQPGESAEGCTPLWKGHELWKPETKVLHLPPLATYLVCLSLGCSIHKTSIIKHIFEGGHKDLIK